MQKQGRSRKGLIIGIIAAVMLLVALAVTMAACNQQPQNAAPTTAPVVEADEMDGVTIYWNVDRAEYDGKSEAGMSSRKMESDGFFHVRFFKDGEFIELKCADRKLINSIDVNDVVGVRVDEEGLISQVYSVAQLPIEKVAWKFYVQSVGGNTIKVNSSDKFNGMELVLKLENGLKVYDMSGDFDPVGTETTAAINDRILAYSDLDGNLLGVFIYDRSNMIIKTEGYCQHCDEVVIWQEWKNEKALPIDGAQQTHYKLVTDIQLTGQQSMKEDSKLCIDLNGHRVDGADGKRMYSVHNLNCEVAIMDTSEAQTGVLAGHGQCNAQGVVFFVRYGAVYFYGGTIDASDVVTTHGNGGTAVYVAAQRFFYMNGGEIIGGTAVHQYNEETKKYSAGMGATIFNKGKFVLNDGVIRDGYAKSVKTVSNGKVTYQRGIGGNYVGSSGSILEINGGVIKDGKAGTGGNIFLDGTAEMILNNGTISGGRTTDPGRNGGNIYAGAKTTVTINCGTITGGLTRNLGGNIYLLGRLTMNGGVINRGKCLDATTGLIRDYMSSHNLYAGGGSRFSLYGGKIYGSVAIAGTAADVQKKTYVHFGTHAWIDGGDYGKNLSILSAAQKPVVTVGRLRGNAYIGVTAAGIFTAETSENNLAYFHSDIVGADVLYVDNCLAMGRMACLCGSDKHFGACDGTELLWGPWTTATSLPTAEGNYYLLTDVTRTASTGFGSSTNRPLISIDLNGHTVDCKQRMGTSYTDINIVDHAGGGVILGGGPNGGKDHTGVLLMAGTATTSVYGGTIALREDHNTCDTGGVIGVAGGATLNIYGGVIDGSNAKGSITDADGKTTNTVVNNGGAIRVTGTMNMTGGTVIGGDVASKGGAIYMNGSQTVVNLEGGVVRDGTAITGGNIYADSTGTLNILGATVTGGSTKANEKNETGSSNGGNIYVTKNVTMNLTAGSVENGFSVNGGGNIYLAGKLNMSGGEVVDGDSNNYTQRFSKNIMAVNAAVTLSGGLINGHVALVTNGTPGASLTVSGKPVLAGGEYNLRLVSTDTSKYPRPVVTVNGVLADGAKIVINETGVVSGVTVEENVKAFACTDPFNTAILNEENRIAIGYVHCLCGKDTHESWCDGKDLLWQAWDGSANLTASGNYYLSKDVTNGAQRSIGQSGKAATVNLDLCGHTYEGSTRAALVHSKLNIVDSVGGGKLTGNGPDNGHTGTLLMASGAEVNLYQGTVTLESDHNSITYGGVVGVGGGSTLNVWPDGVIDGSHASVPQHAGAVRLTGVLNLKGGTILGGTAKVGGAIAIEKGGVLNMTSGTVTGGKTPDGSGGNIGMYSGSTANITGGTVSGGEALNIGGNIWLIKPDEGQSGASLTVGGDAKILGGKTTAGGSIHGGSIHVENGTAMVLKDQAEVSGGVSAGGGGNIFVSGTLTIRDNAVVKGGKANGGGQSYGHNILVNSGTLNLEGGVVEGYISGVNVGATANCFINISGSPEVNKGTSNLRLTYASSATEYPVVSVTGPISGENKIGIRLETKSNYTIDGVANTGLFIKNANGAAVEGEKFFYADAPTGGQVVLMEDGLNVHGEGYRTACACGGRLEGSEYHTCKKVTWKPWKTATKLPTEGYYYLSTDIACASSYSLSGVKADRELGIDLNGHTVKAASGSRIFQLYDSNVTDNTYSFKLTITDNGNGKGKLIPNATLSSQAAAIWITEKTQTVNLFGGTVDGSAATLTNKNPGGVISVGRGVLNIYDGTVLGCTYKNTEGNSLGGAIGITNNHNGGTLNLYGGSVVGGSADLGDAIYVDAGAAKFNAYGGTVIGSVYNLGTMTVGGTAQLDEVELADGVKLTVADDFDAAKASVGIKMATPGVFAENVATDLSNAFTSLDTSYVVNYTSGKALELKAMHVHCWCYGSDVKPEGHVCENDLVWEAINSSDANPFVAEDGGHYHLNWSWNVAKKFSVPDNATVYLCLAGGSMRAANVIDLGENSKIVICDCKGTGVLTTTANSPLIADQNATIVLMSGTVNGTYGTTASRISVLVTNTGFFEMYGGTITGGCVNEDNITDAAKKEDGTRGGNVMIRGEAKLMGGTITGGKYKGADRDVTLYSEGKLTVGGKVKIGYLMVAGTKLAVVEKDLQAQIGVTTTAPTSPFADVKTDVSGCFTSVHKDYDTVGWQNGGLYLGKKADHQHCFCENADALPAGHKCDTLIAWTAVEKSAGSNVYLEDGGHYYLNWTGSSAQVINVPDDVEAYLCLNGATIYATQAIKLNNNSVLHICDCSAGETGTITVSGASTTAIILMNSGVRTVNLYSGRILGSANANKRICVSMAGGTPTFNMYGGTLTGGYNTDHAGNVSITGVNAKFNMFGGTISGGEVASGKHGGNIYMSKGQFVMDGGTITGGKATGGKGGNVILLPNGATATFTMNGGVIENGSAANGGNIALNALGTSGRATFTMNGGTVKGGTVTTAGENLFLYSARDSVIVNAGSILGGTVANAGGGSITVGAGATVDGLN